MVRLPPRQSGFTYVWVLITVALTSALLAVGAQLASDRVARDRDTEYAWVVEQYRLAVRSFMQAGVATGPASLNSLHQLVRDERGGVVRRHLRQPYPNPRTGNVDWIIGTGPTGEPLILDPASRR